MEIHYKDNHLKRVCEEPEYAMQFYQPKIVHSLQLLMSRLDSNKTFDVFYKAQAYRRYKAHPLKGDKKNIVSLRLDYSYRLELIVLAEKNERGEDILTILEVTNHYGD